MIFPSSFATRRSPLRSRSRSQSKSSRQNQIRNRTSPRRRLSVQICSQNFLGSFFARASSCCWSTSARKFRAVCTAALMSVASGGLWLTICPSRTAAPRKISSSCSISFVLLAYGESCAGKVCQFLCWFQLYTGGGWQTLADNQTVHFQRKCTKVARLLSEFAFANEEVPDSIPVS